MFSCIRVNQVPITCKHVVIASVNPSGLTCVPKGPGEEEEECVVQRASYLRKGFFECFPDALRISTSSPVASTATGLSFPEKQLVQVCRREGARGQCATGGGWSARNPFDAERVMLDLLLNETSNASEHVHFSMRCFGQVHPPGKRNVAYVYDSKWPFQFTIRKSMLTHT